MNNSSGNKRIAKNTLLLYLRMAVVLLVSLYTTRVVLQNLGVVDYGIYNVICGFVLLFGFLNSTLSSSINRYYNYEIGQGKDGKVNDVYNNALRIQALLAIILFVVIEIVGVWYINNKMVIPIERLTTSNWIFHFSLLSLILTIFQSPYIAAILAYERMNYYALVSIVDVFLKLIIAVVISLTNADRLWLFGLLSMLVSALNFIMYAGYVKLYFKHLFFIKSTDTNQFKSMLSFSFWSLLNPLAYTGRSQGCNIVLNFFFGPISNAAYAITNQVASGIDSFIGAVSVASRPQIIQSYSQGEYSRTEQLFFSTSKIMYAMIALLVVPIAFNINFILNIWIGDNVPKYTSIFCIWILAVKLVDSLNPSVTNLIMATGKIKRYMTASSIIIMSIIPLSIAVFFSYNNPVSMFVIMFVCTCINQISSIIILHISFCQISIKKYIKRVLLTCVPLPFLQASILYFTHISYNGLPILILILDLLLSTLFAIIYSYVFIFDKDEKRFFRRLIIK